eukprot:1207036-Rhodomonas_salina.3
MSATDIAPRGPRAGWRRDWDRVIAGGGRMVAAEHTLIARDAVLTWCMPAGYALDARLPALT